MKKLLSIILSIAMVCAMCVGVTALATTGSGTSGDPYVVSSWTEFSAVIDSAPTDNMTGTPTYIRLSDNISDNTTHAINSGKNIDLDLNQHTLKCSRFDLVSAKLNIHNGTVQSNDAAIGYASYALGALDAELTADGVTFRGGNGTASGVTGGFGATFDGSTFSIKNCTFISGDSFSDAHCQSAIFIIGNPSTGTISNTTLTKGAGLDRTVYPTLRITEGCTVTDGDGNPLTSSGINEELVVIPASSRDLPITEVDGTKSSNVNGTYQTAPQADAVYRVDITWGSMEFTYTAEGVGAWSPADHAYVGTTPATWTCATDANKITVTNHSNVAIDATFAYANASGYSLTTVFHDSTDATITKLSLPTAEEYQSVPAGARTSEAYMNITGGSIEDSTADNTVVGTVTVTITAQSGNESGEGSL